MTRFSISPDARPGNELNLCTASHKVSLQHNRTTTGHLEQFHRRVERPSTYFFSELMLIKLGLPFAPSCSRIRSFSSPPLAVALFFLPPEWIRSEREARRATAVSQEWLLRLYESNLTYNTRSSHRAGLVQVASHRSQTARFEARWRCVERLWAQRVFFPYLKCHPSSCVTPLVGVEGVRKLLLGGAINPVMASLLFNLHFGSLIIISPNLSYTHTQKKKNMKHACHVCQSPA